MSGHQYLYLLHAIFMQYIEIHIDELNSVGFICIYQMITIASIRRHLELNQYDYVTNDYQTNENRISILCRL